MSDIVKQKQVDDDIDKIITNITTEIERSSDLVNRAMDLLKISTSITDTNKFKVIDEEHLAEIEKSLPEIVDKTFAFGKKNTQFTSMAMTLDMIDFTPMRKLRQIFAQIENKKSAIKENVLRVKKRSLRLKKIKKMFEEEKDPLKKEQLKLMMLELILSINEGLAYYEGAVKEYGMFLQAYKDIKKKYNIPDDWDEEDVEKAEIEEHIKSAFRNLLRDLRMTGRPGMGTQEYLEQLGINPSSAIELCREYLAKEDEILQAYRTGKTNMLPTYANLRQFLDNVYAMFKDEPLRKLSSMGLRPYYVDWLYKKDSREEEGK